jgi:hypothetical protein
MEKYKMKKISLIAGLIGISVLSANPYVGLQLSGNFLKNQAKLGGKALTPGQPQLFDISSSVNAKLNAAGFGLVLGYAFPVKDKVSLMIEGDVSFTSKKTTFTFDTSTINTISHLNEKGYVKASFGFGLMPMVSYHVQDKLSGLFGVRFTANRYEVNGYHLRAGQTTPDALFTKTEKKFLFGIEPNLGAKYDFSDKVAGRFLVGYNFGSKKTVIENYFNTPAAIANSATSSISINPKGVVVKAAITCSF